MGLLSLKRLLIKMLDSMATKAVTFTYVSNSCVASNLFTGRGWRCGNIVSINISFNISTVPGTTFTTIGTVSAKPTANIDITTAGQNNNGTVYVRITTDGNIQIYNATGSPTGWFRLSASYIV